MVRELGFTQTPKYTKAMMKLLQSCQHKYVNLMYSIVEVESWLISIRKSLQFLRRERIYFLIYIIKKANLDLAILLLV